MGNNIIGITGKKRSGKDSIADYLIDNHGYTRYAFADPIKRGLMEMFGFTDEQMWGSEQDKETVDPRWGISPRRLVQITGTELYQFDLPKYLREGEFPWGRGVWTRKFKLWYLDELEENPNLKVVISDVRYPHEEEIIHGLNGTMVKVIRPSLGESTDQHSSETDIDLIIPDITLINDGTLEELFAKVEDEVIPYQYKKTSQSDENSDRNLNSK